MEILFQSKDILKQLLIFEDRVEIKGIASAKILPMKKIANVSFNKMLGRLTIETSGGEKSEYNFFGFGGWHKAEEATRIITKIIASS